MDENKWVVIVHGKPNDGDDWGSFEISVVRNNYDLGKRSCGWFNKNKLKISGSGGHSHTPVTQKVWDKLIKVAHEVANELNEEEQCNPDS